MPTLLDFRRRIRSVKSSQQITRAMKFVAAARLRRAQEAALAARPYAQELARLLRSVMSRIQDVSNPLMAQREEKNILAIVMTGERGLAGASNANILRKANEFFRENSGKKIVTIPVGKKGRERDRRTEDRTRANRLHETNAAGTGASPTALRRIAQCIASSPRMLPAAFADCRIWGGYRSTLCLRHHRSHSKSL